jgi:hypothetical protein
MINKYEELLTWFFIPKIVPEVPRFDERGLIFVKEGQLTGKQF